MIVSNFRKCNSECKRQLFKAFCYNLYGCALWSTFRAAGYRKIKIAHNDIFRSQLNVPRWESASTLFAEHMVKNLDAIVRTAMHSLMARLLASANPLVQAARFAATPAPRTAGLWHSKWTWTSYICF